jgi:hypothetical protein
LLAPNATSEMAVDADLASAAYRIGVLRGFWRQLSYTFPILYIAVAAIEPDGSSSEYSFRFELTGFPATAPRVTIWDVEAAAPLAPPQRPKGSQRVNEAFKQWGSDTIYRPWDREGGLHNSWSTTHPGLAWHSSRHLTFILEDLHGLLTSNNLSQPVRQIG